MNSSSSIKPIDTQRVRTDVVAAMNRLNELYSFALEIPARLPSSKSKSKKSKQLDFSTAIYEKLQFLCCQGTMDSALDKFNARVKRRNGLERCQDRDRKLFQDILHQCYEQAIVDLDVHVHSRYIKRASSDDEETEPKRYKKSFVHKLDVVQTRTIRRPGPEPKRFIESEFDKQIDSANTSRTSLAPSVFSVNEGFGATQTTVEASQEYKQSLSPEPTAVVKQDELIDLEPNSDEVQAFEEAHGFYPNPSEKQSPSSSIGKSSSDRYSSFPEDIDIELCTAKLKPNAAKVAIQERLMRVWPDFPRWLYHSPLAIAWEVTRIALHCNIDLGDVKGLKYDSSWQNPKTLRSALYKHHSFQGRCFPEQCGTDAWNAALNNSENVVLAAEMDVNRDSTGPLFFLKLKAFRIEQSHRLSRHFGADRFLEILYPSHASSFAKNSELLSTLNTWLSRGSHSFLGRRWAAFFTKDAGYRRPATEVRLGPDPKPVFKDRVYFFSEGEDCCHARRNASAASFGYNSFAPAKNLPISDMLNWLLQLDLPENQNQPWPKLFSRIQLGLSRTHPTVEFEATEIRVEENDLLSPAGNVMNDGIGLMSRSVARQIQQILCIDEVPCAVQGRLGSAKGMWIIDPFDQTNRNWISTYPSQRKWKCTSMDPHHRTLEIKQHAKSLRSAGLNLQFLPVLHDRSRHKHKMRDDIGNLLRISLQTELESVKVALRSPQQFLQWVHENSNHRQPRLGSVTADVPRLGGLPERDEDTMAEMVRAGFDPKKQKYLQEIAWRIQRQKCEALREKLNIKVGMSTYALMVVDFWGVVPEGEVHLCFSDKFSCDGFSDTLLNNQEILVARSPAHYVSDIQKVKAVFRPELKDLKDVIVFSSKGDVALAGKLSGGDYDGDIAWVCWDSRIVDDFENAAVPDTYPDLFKQGYLSKVPGKMADFVREMGLERGTREMVAQGFEFNMRQNFLGICTNFKEKLCYKRGNVNDSVAIILSTLVSNLVDQGKQGIVFDAASWSRLQAELTSGRGPPELPLYKQNSWRGSKSPEHVIDYLKFAVAKPLIDKELGDFNKSLMHSSGEEAHYWDYDLVEIYNMYDRMKSSSMRTLLDALRSDIDKVARLWKGSDRQSDYRDKVSRVYEAWLAIQPAVDKHRSLPNSRMVAMLVPSFLHPEQTPWAMLKASMAFKLHIRDNPSFVWRIAGAQLMLIKSTARQNASAAVTQSMIPFLKPDKKMIERFTAMQQGNESLYGSGNAGTDYGGDSLFDGAISD